MVGVAAAAAHRLVGCPYGGRKLERRDEPRGSAGEALRSHEQSLCHPLDGVFRPVPAVLYHGGSPMKEVRAFCMAVPEGMTIFILFTLAAFFTASAIA